MHRHLRSAAAAFGLAAAAACSRKTDTGATVAGDTTKVPVTTAVQPVSVSGVQLGRSLGTDGRVASEASTFKPTDTIYAAVNTEGASTSAMLSARWTYQDGQVVDTTSRAIAPTGAASTEFHIAKPSGWPKGSYKVEIMLNGAPAASKDFKVE
jgi:hypothetical protein